MHANPTAIKAAAVGALMFEPAAQEQTRAPVVWLLLSTNTISYESRRPKTLGSCSAKYFTRAA